MSPTTMTGEKRFDEVTHRWADGSTSPELIPKLSVWDRFDRLLTVVTAIASVIAVILTLRK